MGTAKAIGRHAQIQKSPADLVTLVNQGYFRDIASHKEAGDVVKRPRPLFIRPVDQANRYQVSPSGPVKGSTIPFSASRAIKARFSSLSSVPATRFL